MSDLLVNYKPVQVDRQEIPDFQLPIINQYSSYQPYSSQTTNSSNQMRFAGWSTPSQQSPSQTASAQSNLTNMSFEDLIKKHNLPIQITSGFRGKGGFRGGKTKSGKQSNHNRVDEHGHPMAYDIQPLVNGRVDKSDSAFANLRNMLSNNQEVREWFRQRNWGILDETTPQMMAKTGATGKHFHIGPDSAAIRFS